MTGKTQKWPKKNERMEADRCDKKERIKNQLNEWMNERKEGMNEGMKGSRSEGIAEWMKNESMKEWKNDRIKG